MIPRDIWWVRGWFRRCYAHPMRLTEQQLFDALARMPFADTLELAVILGEAYATVHRALTGLLADGIAGRVNHGTAHLPTSGRWFLTAEGIGEASAVLGYAAPSDFVRAYPVSQQWLTLLLRRMDAVASVYRLAMALSPGTLFGILKRFRSRLERVGRVYVADLRSSRCGGRIVTERADKIVCVSCLRFVEW